MSSELENLFEPGESPKLQQGISPGSRGSPGSRVTGKDEDECQEKIPELREFLQNISEER